MRILFLSRKFIGLASLLLVDFFAQPLDAQMNYCLGISEGGPDYEDTGEEIITDRFGNIYVTGCFGPGALFDGSPVPYVGNVDLFLVKYNSSGQTIWVRAFGGTGADRGTDLKEGADGFIYLTGHTRLGNVPGGDRHFYDAFVAKYDTAGNQMWLKRMDGTDYSDGENIAVTPSAFLYSTGTFRYDLTMFGDTLIGNGEKDIFLAKFDSAGNKIWHLGFGGSEDEEFPVVTNVGSDGGILAFTFSDTITVGGNTYVSVASTDILIVRFDPNGTILWTKAISGHGTERNYKILCPNENEFYLASTFTIDLSLNGNVLFSTGQEDIALMKFDASGNLIWYKQGKGNSFDIIVDIETDAAENIYVGGACGNEMIFGTDTIFTVPFEDWWLAKLDSAGNLISKMSHGVPGERYIGGFAADVFGNFICTGNYAEFIDLGADHFVCVDSSADIFIFKAGESPVLDLDSMSGPPKCLNDNFVVWFNASGCFGPSNQFQAQLSDAAGSFASPVLIGSTSGYTQNFINATIPPATVPGAGYKVRVVSTDDPLTGITLSPAFSISSGSMIPVQITGDSSTCNGVPANLDAGIGFTSYLWTNGAITQNISVISPGWYGVDVTDTSGCKTHDEQYVMQCVGISSSFENEFAVYPNPAQDELFIHSDRIPLQIDLVNILGESQSVVFQPDLSSGNIKADIQQLPDGIYFMLLQFDEQNISTRTIVIQHIR